MRVFMLAAVLLAACSGSDEEAATEEAESDKSEAVADAPPPVPEMPDTPEDVAAPPADAEKSESGLASKVLKKGTGSAHPSAKSLVTVHYTGWRSADGEMFDSSIKRGRPALFGLNGVIKGWTEGVQLMVEGETRRFWVPADLAYGEAPENGRPAGQLVFDIELVDFVDTPESLTPPETATTTASGLAYKQLSKGSGSAHPTADDFVHLHFIAWDKEGNMAQTSRRGPRPLSFKLDGAIPGWKEAIAMMTVGEKARFWMPDELVPVPSGPNGIAVFDFELLKIDNPLPAPESVNAPPADATKTESGLAYKQLEKGTGTDKPTEANAVRVNFTVWSAADGKMLETTTFADRPATMPLSGVPVAGLKEALTDMVAGEKRRLWIPEELGFKNAPPGAPKGMLVYDVELVDISPGGPRALPPQLRQQLEQRGKAKVKPADAAAPE